MHIKTITYESCDDFRLKSDRNLSRDQNLWTWIYKGYKVNILKVNDEKIYLTKCERHFEWFFLKIFIIQYARIESFSIINISYYNN